jgi:hypothetical protein
MSGYVIDHYGAEWLWGLCAVVGTVAAVGYGALMHRLPTEAEAPVDGPDADGSPTAPKTEVSPA